MVLHLRVLAAHLRSLAWILQCLWPIFSTAVAWRTSSDPKFRVSLFRWRCVPVERKRHRPRFHSCSLQWFLAVFWMFFLQELQEAMADLVTILQRIFHGVPGPCSYANGWSGELKLAIRKAMRSALRFIAMFTPCRSSKPVQLQVLDHYEQHLETLVQLAGQSTTLDPSDDDSVSGFSEEDDE